MSWKPMRIPNKGEQSSLPGDRGRWLLWLGPALVEGEGHWVHFSWKDQSFCIRDFLRQQERRQEPGFTSADVWAAATDRVPCKGELYVPVENFEFWDKTLRELTEKHRQGRGPGFWSRLSSKFASKPEDPSVPVGHEGESEGADLYDRFVRAWKEVPGFSIVDGTVGCSARHGGQPLLWVYPTYFQIAPRAKGNTHFKGVLSLRDHYFPEFRDKGQVSFHAPSFSWDRFREFFSRVQQTMQSGSDHVS